MSPPKNSPSMIVDGNPEGDLIIDAVAALNAGAACLDAAGEGARAEALINYSYRISQAWSPLGTIANAMLNYEQVIVHAHTGGSHDLKEYLIEPLAFEGHVLWRGARNGRHYSFRLDSIVDAWPTGRFFGPPANRR